MTRVRLHIYRTLVETGRAPSAPESAIALGQPVEVIEAAYRQLADDKVIVLRPGTLDVWMAMPFSAVPTPYRVSVGERWWYANCGWDALGIAAAINDDARITTQCADCGESLVVETRNGRVVSEGVLHFAIPTARWWDDIGLT